MSSWYKFLKPALMHFRTKRAEEIVSRFPNLNELSVLDLGGSLHFWDEVGGIIKPKSLTILNLAGDTQSVDENASDVERSRIISYDGKTIPFEANSFDLVLCNSVFEHVPVAERPGLAAEIRRVGRAYVVQTPAYAFPIEPHLVMPIAHWLPRPVGRFLSQYTPLAIFNSKQYAIDMFDEVYLLNRREVEQLFPESSIVSERFAGVVKSYTAIMQQSI